MIENGRLISHASYILSYLAAAGEAAAADVPVAAAGEVVSATVVVAMGTSTVT